MLCAATSPSSTMTILHIKTGCTERMAFSRRGKRAEKSTRSVAYSHLFSFFFARSLRKQGQLLLSLVVELANEQQSEVIRQQAGLYIKVQLSAEEESIRAHKMQQWSAIDDPTKNQIKAGSLQVSFCLVSQYVGLKLGDDLVWGGGRV